MSVLGHEELNSLSPMVRVERDGPLLIVTLDNPKRLNAVDAVAQRALDSIWNHFFADAGARAAILTGTGDKAFCAGADLASLALAGRELDDAEPRTENGHFGLTHRENFPKPIIAAVNGLALGGGFEMVLCCDIVIAAENARFSLPEPLMGGAALAGGVARLTRKIPINIAAGMLLTARQMPAAEAQRLGLVNEIVPTGGALEAAKRWAADILKCAPLSLAATKEVIDASAQGASVAELLELGDVLFERLKLSDDVQEGIKAFAEKRAPQWQGR